MRLVLLTHISPPPLPEATGELSGNSLGFFPVPLTDDSQRDGSIGLSSCGGGEAGPQSAVAPGFTHALQS